MSHTIAGDSAYWGNEDVAVNAFGDSHYFEYGDKDTEYTTSYRYIASKSVTPEFANRRPHSQHMTMSGLSPNAIRALGLKAIVLHGVSDRSIGYNFVFVSDSMFYEAGLSIETLEQIGNIAGEGIISDIEWNEGIYTVEVYTLPRGKDDDIRRGKDGHYLTDSNGRLSIISNQVKETQRKTYKRNRRSQW